MKKEFFIIVCFLITHNLFSQEIFRPDITNRELKEITYKLPFFSTPQKIKVEMVDGYAIFQGDIILYNVNDKEYKDAGREGRGYRWDNGVIPFEIQMGHPRRADILTAIQLMQREIPICLVQRNGETDFVEFVNGSGCSSQVGCQGGRQEITIGGCPIGSIQHEILHTIGMHHEQCRSDRDDYVRIIWANIPDSLKHNFEKVSNTISFCNYDFGSIMHYSDSLNSQPTIETIDPLPPGVDMGQRIELSNCDIQGVVNLYYNFSNTGGCIERLRSEGKITFLRIHDVGTGWGAQSNIFDFDVIIKLDSEDNRVFGFQIRNDEDEFSHIGMLDNLRSAFNRDLRIRIEYDFIRGLNAGQIIRIMNSK